MMARKEKGSTGKKSPKVNPGQKPEYSIFRDERIRFIAGLVFTGFAVYLFLPLLLPLLVEGRPEL
ncbi:MAG: hypothetical protein R2744_02300 [Bacteroidales bacterium]